MQSAPDGQFIQIMPGGTTVTSGAGVVGANTVPGTPGMQSQQVIYMPSPGTSGQMVMYQQQGESKRNLLKADIHIPYFRLNDIHIQDFCIFYFSYISANI